MYTDSPDATSYTTLALVGATGAGGATGSWEPSSPSPWVVSSMPVTGTVGRSSSPPPLPPNANTSTTTSTTRITAPAMRNGSFDCTPLGALGPA